MLLIFSFTPNFLKTIPARLFLKNAVKNCDDLDILLEMLLVCDTNFLPKVAMEIMIKISKTDISSENMFAVLESVCAWKRLGGFEEICEKLTDMCASVTDKKVS